MMDPDKVQQFLLGAAGDGSIEAMERRFIVGTVFDVSQTEAVESAVAA